MDSVNWDFILLLAYPFLAALLALVLLLAVRFFGGLLGVVIGIG